MTRYETYRTIAQIIPKATAKCDYWHHDKYKLKVKLKHIVLFIKTSYYIQSKRRDLVFSWSLCSKKYLKPGLKSTTFACYTVRLL